MHYNEYNLLGEELKQEAIISIEQIAQHMSDYELMHYSRPLAIAYLALTEEGEI